MKKRTVRPLQPQHMKDYINIYLNAYPAGKDLSEECYEKYYNRNMQSLQEFDHVNFFGLFEEDDCGGEILIAIMKLIDFDMNFFSKMSRATGLMSLGVHPLHKRKGAARDMVKFFEEYTVKTGGVVSMLLPFRMDFYKKLGYGCGSKLDEYHIPTGYLPECTSASGLRLLRKDETDMAIECYTEFVHQNHGAVCKFEEEIRDMRNDDDIRRLGYFEDGKLRGYAAFTFENTSNCNYTLNLMDVKELIYHDTVALRKLLGGLRMQSDLAQSVIIRTGEPDFYHLLESCQDVSGNYIDFGFLQTNVSAIGTMYKIPDIGYFVKASAHRRFVPVNMAAGFCVTDDVTGHQQKFTLAFCTPADCSGEACCSHWTYDDNEESYEKADVHVNCCLSDLSSLLMGSAEFGAMARLGVMQIDKPEFIYTLDMIFHPEQRPFTNTDY